MPLFGLNSSFQVSWGCFRFLFEQNISVIAFGFYLLCPQPLQSIKPAQDQIIKIIPFIRCGNVQYLIFHVYNFWLRFFDMKVPKAGVENTELNEQTVHDACCLGI